MRPCLRTLLCLSLFAAACSPGHLKLEGVVSFESGPATQVTVTALCGPQMVSADADANGKYALELDTTGCSRLVLDFTKESALPLVYVVDLPAPQTPLKLNPTLKALNEVLCGAAECVTADQTSRFPHGQFARAWALSESGPRALADMGGTFEDDTGAPIWLGGFTSLDLRDASGTAIAQVEQPFANCLALPTEFQAMLVDVDPSTPTVQMNQFALDRVGGSWLKGLDLAAVKNSEQVTDPTTQVTHEELVDLPASKLADVRAGLFSKKVWVCPVIHGSGTVAWGLELARKSCVRFAVKNQCKTAHAIANAELSVTGVGYGFFAQTLSDSTGGACVEIATSEPTQSSYDGDELQGETFFLDVAVNLPDATGTHLVGGAGGTAVGARTSFEAPRTEGSCAQPESCLTVPALSVNQASASCTGG